MRALRIGRVGSIRRARLAGVLRARRFGPIRRAGPFLDASLEVASGPVARHSQDGPVDSVSGAESGGFVFQAPGPNGSPPPRRIRLRGVLLRHFAHGMTCAHCPQTVLRSDPGLSRPRSCFSGSSEVARRRLPGDVIGTENRMFASGDISMWVEGGVRRHSCSRLRIFSSGCEPPTSASRPSD